MSRAKPPRHKRPVRFNRTRANPIQRVPFYRQSHARHGDYWRMPSAQGYLMGREIGRVSAVAFLQALDEAAQDARYVGSAHLADVVSSVVEANGGQLTDSQRGLIDGFFGRSSVLCRFLIRGLQTSRAEDQRYTILQLEEALTDLASLGAEEYALRRTDSVQAVIPDRRDHPEFELR